MLKCQHCWHFLIYYQDKFCAQLNIEHDKGFITSGPVHVDLNLIGIDITFGHDEELNRFW